MSEVISFRLDPKNPREAKALQILDSMKSEGYSIRQIIMEALLSYRQPKNGKVGTDMIEMLEQISEVLKSMEIQSSEIMQLFFCKFESEISTVL